MEDRERATDAYERIRRVAPPSLTSRFMRVRASTEDIVAWLATPHGGIIAANLVRQSRWEEVERMLDRYPIGSD